MYGPKASGTWPSGVSLAGTNGTNGTNGATGATGPAGTTVHSALTGLGGDDHTQYHNNTRGDARYQPLDATLTALAGVTTAADKLIYATGSDAFATCVLTTQARSLLDDTTAAAQRTTLGIETVVVSPLAADTPYTGTSSAYTIILATITIPTTGLWRVTALVQLLLTALAGAVGFRLQSPASGGAVLAGVSGRVLGIAWDAGGNPGAVAQAPAVLITGSPTILSGASVPGPIYNANQPYNWEGVIDVTTAGTLELRLMIGGTSANALTAYKGCCLEARSL